MNVFIAKSGGFCKGVKSAVDTAMSVPSENTYILGELIHNKLVTDGIAERGIKTVSCVGEVPDGASLIIRSHGAERKIFEECNRRNIKVIDCTCPFVKRTQNIVSRINVADKTLVIIGEKSHPEVLGILGWFDGEAVVINSPEAVEIAALSDKNPVIVSQTTFSEENFNKIIKNIAKVCKKTVEVFKTICYTTKERQREAEKLSSL